MNTTAQITVQADIAAKPEKVWDFYTNPRHITQWNFASEDWQCTNAENDMRVGGKYRSRMEAKDGSWGFDFEAIYDKIENKRSFTYTMTDGRKATVHFKPNSSGTHVQITFDAEGENSVDMQREGWQAILNNFKKYTESN